MLRSLRANARLLVTLLLGALVIVLLVAFNSLGSELIRADGSGVPVTC